MFVFALILMVVGALIGAGALFMGGDERAPGCGLGVVILVVGGLLLGGTCLTSVGTKEVGIVTAFNRPVGSLDNGLHLKLPWEEVTEMDAAIQTDNYFSGADASKGQNPCISVRIAHQIVACSDVTIRWRIDEGAAPQLFQDYRDFGNVSDSLVTRELSTQMNAAMGDYDPLAVDADGNSTSPPLGDLATRVQQKMQAKIGAQVTVLSVFIPVLHYDDSTQSRINGLQGQVAQTRIAQQAVKTADQQAAANQALAASVSTDPNVLVSKCLDILNEMVSKNQGNYPAGFSCWPGGGTGVVLPATK